MPHVIVKTCYQEATEWFWDYLGANTTEYPVAWTGAPVSVSVPANVYQTQHYIDAHPPTLFP